MQAQGRNFTIFIIEQSQQYLFNRGALLNTAVQLLQASHYDYFAFQDVDTIPRNKSTIQYSYPAGDAPLHLTPFRIHPAANFQVSETDFQVNEAEFQVSAVELQVRAVNLQVRAVDL